VARPRRAVLRRREGIAGLETKRVKRTGIICEYAAECDQLCVFKKR